MLMRVVEIFTTCVLLLPFLLFFLCRVAPSTQQHFLLPVLHDANAKKVFLILHVRPDSSKLAEQIKQQSTKVHLHQLQPMQVRTKLLLMCQQERVRPPFE